MQLVCELHHSVSPRNASCVIPNVGPPPRTKIQTLSRDPEGPAKVVLSPKGQIDKAGGTHVGLELLSSRTQQPLSRLCHSSS